MGITNECAWCNKPLEDEKRGRPKVYCGHVCRQRAYEARKRINGISDVQTRYLLDRLYELRCQAEDISTAATEGADPQEIRQLCRELIQSARKIENHPCIIRLAERKD